MHWFMPQAGQSGEVEAVHALLGSFHSLRGMWSGFKPPGPIRRSDFMLLGTLAQLAQTGPATVSGLARAMHQSVPGISQRVAELERRGYIRRAQNSKDKRSASLCLTKQGSTLLEEGSKVFLARVHKVVETFGPEKTTQLVGLMEELQQVVQATRDEEEAEDIC